MPIKFARLNYVKTHDDIPIRFNVVKQDLESNLSWYIDRYNPLVITDCSIAGEVGVNVLLPLTELESLANTERAKKIIVRTMECLISEDVEIVLPPSNISIDRMKGISVADGTKLFPFLLCQAIKKWATLTQRDLRRCEAAIINDNFNLTNSILDHICSELNFLTIVDLNDDKDRLSDKADRIFDDTGLNIIVRGKNKLALKTADIVINTSSADFDTAYKRKAIVFDLSGDIERRKHLLVRRPDIQLFDGLVVNYKNTAIPLAMFEMALYLKNRHFRNITINGYNPETGLALSRVIKRLGLGVYSFTQLGQIIKNDTIAKF